MRKRDKATCIPGIWDAGFPSSCSLKYISHKMFNMKFHVKHRERAALEPGHRFPRGRHDPQRPQRRPQPEHPEQGVPGAVCEDEQPHRGNAENQQEAAEEDLRLGFQRGDVPGPDTDGPSHLRQVRGDTAQEGEIDDEPAGRLG